MKRAIAVLGIGTELFSGGRVLFATHDNLSFRDGLGRPFSPAR
jgi:hypothetical protein